MLQRILHLHVALRRYNSFYYAVKINARVPVNSRYVFITNHGLYSSFYVPYNNRGIRWLKELRVRIAAIPTPMYIRW